jgi:probable F420-dependent oxidoreductase
MNLSGTGIWSSELRRLADADRGEADEAAVELEELGYSALWLPGGDPATALDALSGALRATSSITVASGILSVWMHDPEMLAAQRAELSDSSEGRFLLGLGVSHAPLVGEDTYRKPLAKMRTFLESLDVAAPPVLPETRVLAALGPRMLELARDRALGAHPYLVTPEHTRSAREILGVEKFLAPEQGVVLDSDPDSARAIARQHLSIYLQLPNYTNNLRRLGFGDADLSDGGSDRLVDEVVAWGDEVEIRSRVEEHREAGADQVVIQVLTDRDELPRAEWRELAPVLTDA